MSPTAAIVLPTYNEAGHIDTMIRQLRAVTDAHILVVDDSSPDGTADRVRALAENTRDLQLLLRPRREGLGPAYRAGFRAILEGPWERVVQMDADGSHEPSSVPALLSALDRADVALGSRFIDGAGPQGWPRYRRWLSRAAHRYGRLALGLPDLDMTSGFRAWRSSALRTIDVGATQAQGFAFQIETLLRSHHAGLTIAPVPIGFPARAAGQSKLNPGIIWEATWRVASWRRTLR